MEISSYLFNTRYFLYFFLTFFLYLILYNSFGDSMKKYFWSIVLSLVVGIYLGKFTLSQYDSFNVFPVSFGYDNVYFLQQGVYSNVDVMKNSMSSFNYYIYDLEDDGYHTYVGITKNQENALKVKEYFNNMGYDSIIKDNRVSNGVFVSIVSQYDLVLKDASDDAIGDICSQVINSYEELVLNEDKGYSKE